LEVLLIRQPALYVSFPQVSSSRLVFNCFHLTRCDVQSGVILQLE
jgi:hypothetical protein